MPIDPLAGPQSVPPSQQLQLQPSPTLAQAAAGQFIRLGHQGDAVLALKEKLTAAGYDLAPHNIFDAEMDTALRAHQEHLGLNGDGLVGPLTLGRMGLKPNARVGQVNAPPPGLTHTPETPGLPRPDAPHRTPTPQPRSTDTSAPRLDLPSRPAGAPTGSELMTSLEGLSPAERDQRIIDAFRSGNVPSHMRQMHAVDISPEARIFVAPDYVSIGSDDDYMTFPMTAAGAQRLADAMGAVLPTARMVDRIWAEADFHTSPAWLNDATARAEGLGRDRDHAMTTVGAFRWFNQRIADNRAGHEGELIAGAHKDIIAPRPPTRSNRVGHVWIYGAHGTSGNRVQPPYDGHGASWADYPQGARLVHGSMEINGELWSLDDVMRHPVYSQLISDTGVESGGYRRY